MQSPRFNDHAKEEIRLKANIADVVGRYVALKAAGTNLKGLCPFHKEKSPSFTVNPDKGIFHCFGCGKGGDVFAFLMEMEGLEFREVLTMLAEETGVSIQQRPAEQTSGEYQDGSTSLAKAEMLRINEVAMRFYCDQLRASAVAIEYVKGRGISGQTAKDFSIGYAPPGWSNLVDFCQQKGISADALVTCGLAIKKDSTNRAYDRFRERVMFPILDPAGKPIAFGGRCIKPDDEPKYLNSPETPLYHKNRTLYGLSQSRSYIKEQGAMLIVEGYMDFIGLWQAGVRNICATCGTALSTEHGQVIKRFASKIFLVFDGDNAGKRAAQRGAFVLAPHNLDVRACVLPDDHDPDSFVGQYGATVFREHLDKAEPALDFLIRSVSEKPGSLTAHEKSAAIKKLAPYVAAITDPIIRSEAVRQLGQRFSLREELITQQISTQQTPDQSPQEASPAPVPVENGWSTQQLEAFARTIDGNFIRMILTFPALIEDAHQFISVETLIDSPAKNIYSYILSAHEVQRDLRTLLDSVTDPAVKAGLTYLLALPQPCSEGDSKEELTHTIVRLQEKFLRHKIRSVKEEMLRQPEKRSDLLKQLKEYSTHLKELGTTV